MSRPIFIHYQANENVYEKASCAIIFCHSVYRDVILEVIALYKFGNFILFQIIIAERYKNCINICASSYNTVKLILKYI